MKYPRYPEYRASGVDWLGEVPAHWRVKRLKYFATCNDDVLPETTPDDHRLQYVDISSVSLERGVERVEEYDFDQAPSRARRRVRDGDTILSTVRTYLKAVARISRPPDNLIVSTGFAVVRPGAEIDPGYLSYLLRSEGFIGEVVSRSVGVSYPAINASQIMDLLGLVSPLDEQWAIATFLDRETARIDALIATKRRFIALLQEKRAALISRAVTRGLDPDVMLKDSGITWLGSIPEAWALTRIGMLCGVGNGSTPSREEPLYWDDGIHPWLNSSTVNRGVVDYADQFVTGLAIKECHLPPVRPFSILVALTGEGKTRGRAALLTFEATINQHLAYVTPRDERINPRFLRWWLHAHRGALRMLSDGEGGTKGAITCELLKSFPVPLLPHEEQREIARVLDAHDAKVSETARAVDSAIVVLAELRASVIASAVAGKLDTRAAA